jgi:hypothetical protein
MQPFDAPAKALLSGDKQALFLWCFEHCYQAFVEVFRYEKILCGSLWRVDRRYYELSMNLLYERFCYAMTMVVGQFGDFFETNFASQSRNQSEVERRLVTFDVFLSGAADEVFKREANIVAVDDGTQKYFQDFLDDEYEAFWKAHRKFLFEITELRKTFPSSERTYLHGFSRFDYEEDDDETSWNFDCVFMKRVGEQASGNIDVGKFLGQTKRTYLPLILDAFFAQPPEKRISWWQFWKRRK